MTQQIVLVVDLILGLHLHGHILLFDFVGSPKTEQISKIKENSVLLAELFKNFFLQLGFIPRKYLGDGLDFVEGMRNDACSEKNHPLVRITVAYENLGSNCNGQHYFKKSSRGVKGVALGREGGDEGLSTYK